jgi:hypothetical protein
MTSAPPLGIPQRPTGSSGKHFITQAILRRFVGSAGDRLAYYDIERHICRPVGPDRAGQYEKLVVFDEHVAEDLWRVAEERLPEAYRAIEDRSLFDKPELVALLKDSIALHWARSPHARDRSDANFARVKEAQANWWLANRSSDLARWFQERHSGIIPTGPGALRITIQELQATSTEIVNSGLWFSKRVPQFFETARMLAASRPLTVVHAADADFVLGDVPVVLLGHPKTDGPEVAFGDAESALLPIDPHYLLVIGEGEGWAKFGRAEVEDVNKRQLRSARRYVYFQPGSTNTVIECPRRP